MDDSEWAIILLHENDITIPYKQPSRQFSGVRSVSSILWNYQLMLKDAHIVNDQNNIY